MLQLARPDGEHLRKRDTPSGVAFFLHRPAHDRLYATAYDGTRRLVDNTAYPLFGTGGEMHGVVSVFWECTDEAAD